MPQDCRPQLYDLAYSGGPVNASLIKPKLDFMWDFVEAEQNWKKYIKLAVEWQTSTALVSTWFGQVHQTHLGAEEIWNTDKISSYLYRINDVARSMTRKEVGLDPYAQHELNLF